jgi:hypothetical protein
MGEPSAPMSEVDIMKATLCMKDHEIFALRGELDRRMHENQMLLMSIERLEKTVAASYDRLVRKLDRYGLVPEHCNSGKRKRR